MQRFEHHHRLCQDKESDKAASACCNDENARAPIESPRQHFMQQARTAPYIPIS